MLPLHPTAPSSRPDPRRGFALLITVTLLAFLVLLLVSLASLTRVETRVASNSQQLSQARQNALMALNIAIGQLQKHTGPDQRVTARADLILPASVNIDPPTYDLGTGDLTSTGTTGAQALEAIDAYWGDSATPRNRHWTGAWKNSNDTEFDSDDATAFNPIPSDPVWLVSGSESPTDFDPSTPVTGLTLTTTALDDTLRDSVNDTPHRLLVGRATTSPVTAADLQRYVTAPQMPIKATGLPGTAANVDTTIGHYAWWVGDEGIKARADIIDPYAPAPGETLPSDPGNPDNVARRQSAQRLALEAMTTDPDSGDANEAGLAPYFTTSPSDSTKIRITDPRLDALVNASQFSFIEDDSAFRTQLDRHYHDLSVTSRGVLADVKNGGLKHDLSYILSRPSPAEFRTALNTVGSGAPAYNAAPLASGNVAISTAVTPYAEFPSTAAYPPGLLDYSATWEQLWSHYNLGNLTTASPPGAIDTNGVLQTRLPSLTRQGVTPLFVQGKLFYRLRYSGGTVHVDTWPLVVFANPYPTTLAGEFTIRFNMGSDRVRVQSGAPANPSAPAPSEFSDLGGGGDLPNGYLGDIQLVVQATGIPPGEARIFTISPDANRTIAGANDSHVVHMVNDYDPSAFMTYNTGKSLPSDHTHIALYLINGLQAYAFIGTDITENRFATIITRESNDEDDESVTKGFAVYPLAAVDGAEQYGGGAFFTLHDGFTQGPQQSPFLQLNYRAYTTANYSGGSAHPLQWATKFFLEGLPGTAGPDPRMAANLLPPSGTGIPKTTRWGLVSTGDFPEMTTVPAAVNHPANADLGFVNILYDIPRADLPISSLGQLQHFNLAGHPSTKIGDIKPAGWQLNYPIANSYATPRVTRDAVFSLQPDLGPHYDGTYLWNDILWDRFTFSTFPATGNFDFGDPDDHLVNARYKPFRSSQEVPLDDPDGFRGVFEPAKNLLVEGAFNINSTSVDAWKAVLSGLKDIPVGSETSDANLTAPFSRTLRRTGGATGAKAGDTANAWNGFRNLTQDELNAIAEEMVLQVRLRGPFLSMAEFVNRRLTLGRARFKDPESPDRQRLGVSGALQSAIDRVINLPADITNAQFNTKTRAWTSAGDKNSYYGDVDYRASTRIAGFPGYLLQGDVLSAIGANLSARSDTFTIRAYGDVTNPVTGDVEGRAWCEAVVQRLPDYVDPANNPEDIPAAGTPNAEFGRRYQIISFRWLSPNDI